MNGSIVKATCKVCNQAFPSDQFRLHFKLKMMVCPNCFSGKTQKRQEEQKVVAEKPKIPGWDAEDEYLVKAAKMRQQTEKATFKRVPGTQQIKCICHNCTYSFNYDPFRKMPRACPYCNTDIPRLKEYSLL